MIVCGLGVFGVLESLIEIIIKWEPWSVTLINGHLCPSLNELKLRMGEVANIFYLNVLYQFVLRAIQFQFLKPWMVWELAYLCDPLSSAMLQKSGHFFNVIYNWLSFGSDDKNPCKSSHLWEWYSKIFLIFSCSFFSQPKNRRMIGL